MAEVDFADGFDGSEPLLWGLTASQVGTLITGAVLSYLAIRSPLSPAVAIPVVVTVAAAACTLALGRCDGRTLVSWVGAVSRFRARPRHGLLLVVDGAGDGASDRWTAPSPRRALSLAPDGEPAPAPLETLRSVPLVLLPEPGPVPEPDDGVARRGQPAPTGPPPHRGVAGGAVPEASAAPRIGVPTGTDPFDLWGSVPTSLRATRRVTLFSLAGGSGRTTLAAEVAGLLAGRSAAPWPAPGVVLLDLDLMSPRASIRLGVPLLTDWAEALSELPMRGALDRLLRVLPSGLRVVPGPATVPLARCNGGLRPAPGGRAQWDGAGGTEILAGGWRPERNLLPHLSCLVAEVERQGCDTVVLDVPAGLGPVTLWALEAAHDILIVLTPTPGGVQDAYRSTAALRRLGLGHKLRYVVNRSRGDHTFAEAMGDLGGTIVAEIPEDPALERAEAEHRLLAVETSGATAQALRALTATVDARLGTPPPRRAHRILRWLAAG